jgi:hypothetical protein
MCSWKYVLESVWRFAAGSSSILAVDLFVEVEFAVRVSSSAILAASGL